MGSDDSRETEITEESSPEVKASDINQDGKLNKEDYDLITKLINKELEPIVDGSGDILISDVYQNNHTFMPMNTRGYQLASGVYTSINNGTVVPLETVESTFLISKITEGSILVKLQKTDKCWNGKIANQEVSLYQGGKLVETQRTNSDGEALFVNLMTVEDTDYELRLPSEIDTCHSCAWGSAGNTVTRAEIEAAGKEPVVRTATIDTPCTGSIKITATRKGNVVLVYSYKPEYDIIGVKEDGTTVNITHLVLSKDNGGGISGKASHEEYTEMTINATSEYTAIRIKANPESKSYSIFVGSYDNVFAGSDMGTYNNDGKYLEISMKEFRERITTVKDENGKVTGHKHSANVDFFITKAGKLNVDIVKDNSIAKGDSLSDIAKNIGVDVDVLAEKNGNYENMYSDKGKVNYQFVVGPTSGGVPLYTISVNDSNLQYPYYITTEKQYIGREIEKDKDTTFTYKVGAYGTLNVKLTRDISTWLGNVSGVQVGLFQGSKLLETGTTDGSGHYRFDFIDINSNYQYTVKVLDEAPGCHNWEEIATFTSEDFKNEYANGYEIDAEILLTTPCEGKYVISVVREDDDGNLVAAPESITKQLYFTLTDNEGKTHGNAVSVDGSTGKYVFDIPINESETVTDYTLTTDFSLLSDRYEILNNTDNNLNPTLVEFRKHNHTIEVVYKVVLKNNANGNVKIDLDKDVSVHEDDTLTKFKVQLVDSDKFIMPGAQYVDEDGIALFKDLPEGDYVAQFIDYDTPPYTIYHINSDGEEVEDSARAQRTLIGSNGNAGEVIVVVSEGRYVDGESAGLTYRQCGKLMKELGCTVAVPLDGGGSSTMYFNGKVLNSAKGNERAVRDFVYFK